MYCIYCGAKLNEEGRFCHSCGKKVESKVLEDDSLSNKGDVENLKLISQENGDIVAEKRMELFEKGTKEQDTTETITGKENVIKFYLDNEELCYGNNQMQYRNLYIHFAEKIEKAKIAFEKYYRKNIHDFDAIYEQAIPYFMNEARTMVHCGTNILWNYGAHVSEEEFAESVYEGLAEQMQDVLDAFNEILQKIAAKEEDISFKRGMQRLGRGHWTGGGFGIKGAIKGAVTAGMMNIGTDMLRNFSDKVVDKLDQRTITKMKENVYKNPNTLEFFLDYLEICYGYIGASVCSILVHMKKMPDVYLNDRKEYEQAQYYMGKDKKDYSLSPKTFRALCDCLRINPYHGDVYGELYALNYTLRGVLLEMARFFGVGKKVLLLLRDIDSERLRKTESMSESTSVGVEKKLGEYNALLACVTVEERNEICKEIERLEIVLPLLREKEEEERRKEEIEKKKRQVSEELKKLEEAHMRLEENAKKLGASKRTMLKEYVQKFLSFKNLLLSCEADRIISASKGIGFLIDSKKMNILSEMEKKFHASYSGTGTGGQNIVLGLRGELTLPPNKYSVDWEEKMHLNEVEGVHGTYLAQAADFLPLDIIKIPSFEDDVKTIKNNIKTSIDFCDKLSSVAIQWNECCARLNDSLAIWIPRVEELLDRKDKAIRDREFVKEEIDVTAFLYELMNMASITVCTPLLLDEGTLNEGVEQKETVKQYLDELGGRAPVLFEKLVRTYEKQEKNVLPIIFGSGGAWLKSLLIGVVFALLIKKTAPMEIVMGVGVMLTLCTLVMLAEIRNVGFMSVKRISHFIFVAIFALIIFRFTYYFGSMRFFCIGDILVGVILFFAIAGLATTNVKENTEKVLLSTLCNLFALAIELLIRWASGDDFFNIPLIVIHIFLGCMVGSALFEKEE